MNKPYRATNHNLVKALSNAGVSFPSTKKEIFSKLSGIEINVGLNNKMLVTDFCKNIGLETFETKAQFFSALSASLIDLDKI